MQQERGKRERILEAAQSVFARKGYYLSKIEEIAELAGVGKGTVYEYFASKEELYKEMFKVILNRYTEYVMVEVTPEMTVKEWVRRLLEMHLRYMLENRQHMPTDFGDLGGMDTEILGWMYDMRKKSVERLVPVFQKGIERGELKDIDPELGANLLIGMMRGVTLPLMVEGDCGKPSQVAEAMTEILFHGIAR
jgi:TetR/AcrR family fatty acid metabolism transcriptional regulator